jgi:hypothetical protein
MKMMHSRTIRLFMLVISLTVMAQARASTLRNNVADVIMTYARIASAPAEQKRSLFFYASPSMKGDVWLMHLENFMTDHEDLTPAQRSVIFEAVGMIASGLFEESDVASLSPQFAKPFELFQAHARAEFPKSLLAEAFANLGPPDIAANRPRPRLLPGLQGLPVEPPGGLESCGCNLNNDFCDSITNPDFQCMSNGYDCRAQTRGCGWFFLQTCNGRCQSPF